MNSVKNSSSQRCCNLFVSANGESKAGAIVCAIISALVLAGILGVGVACGMSPETAAWIAGAFTTVLLPLMTCCGEFAKAAH